MNNPYLPERNLPAWISVLLLCLLGLGFGVLVYFGLFVRDRSPEQLKVIAEQTIAKAEQVLPTVLQPTVTPTPAVTELPATEPEASSEPEAAPVEPGALDGSDTELRRALTQLGIAGNLLVDNDLLRRSVSQINLLADGLVDVESSPLQALTSGFSADSAAPSISSSMRRYDAHTQALTNIAPATAAALYRKLYPLLNAAQQELGEQASFHTRFNQALNVLITTPQPPIAPALIPHRGAGGKPLWRYANPELENLPPAQKQLLRTGPDNQRAIQQWLRQLQQAIQQAPKGAS